VPPRAGLLSHGDLGLFERERHSRIGSMQRDGRNQMKKFCRLLLLLSGLFGWSLWTAQSARAEIADWDAAVRPLDEGVPQVAVLRLRNILKRELSADDNKTATAKLGEALLASGEVEEALKVLEDPALQDLPATWLWRAQGLAMLQRWPEALALYQKVAAQNPSPFRTVAQFGQAEALRALQRFDEALQVFGLLLADPQWSDRAQLRSIELSLEKRDNAGARRILDKARPVALADKKEKRYLQGRLEAQLNHHGRATELYQTILRRPEGASRAVLIATLCAMAESHLQLQTPEAGDDALEDFIEHHPTDPELPTIFEKLDQLYRAQRQASSQELSRWSNDPAQPRHSLAEWYLARAELRAGRREAASRAYAKLREDHVQLPALAEGLFELAQLEMEARHFDEAPPRCVHRQCGGNESRFLRRGPITRRGSSTRPANCSSRSRIVRRACVAIRSSTLRSHACSRTTRTGSWRTPRNWRAATQAIRRAAISCSRKG
jgi:tetratricopeptide (TPR) repeat protein